MKNYEEQNRQRVTEYLKAGCRENAGDWAGLTLEHIIVHKKNGETVSCYGEKNMEWLLRMFTPRCSNIFSYKRHVIGLEHKDYYLWLGPGGQLVLRIAPQAQIKDTERIYKRFYRRLKECMEEAGYDCVNLGYQPVTPMGQIFLANYELFEVMRGYLDTVGICGEYMMKGTASTQISLYYENEAEFRRKMRSAFILGPILSYVTDNAPYFEGEPYPRRLLRSYIWQRVDKGRTAPPARLFEEDFGFEAYADYVLDIPMITGTMNSRQYRTNLGARELFSDRLMTDNEIHSMLSLAMPEVRFRNAIELRMADSMPIKSALCYLALVKGLFAQMNRLDAYIRGLGSHSEDRVSEAKQTLRKEGGQAAVYGRPVSQIVQELFRLAREGLSESDQPYLAEKKLEKRRVEYVWEREGKK